MTDPHALFGAQVVAALGGGYETRHLSLPALARQVREERDALRAEVERLKAAHATYRREMNETQDKLAAEAMRLVGEVERLTRERDEARAAHARVLEELGVQREMARIASASVQEMAERLKGAEAAEAKFDEEHRGRLVQCDSIGKFERANREWQRECKALKAEAKRLTDAIEKARRHLKDRDIWVGRERAADALDAALEPTDA